MKSVSPLPPFSNVSFGSLRLPAVPVPPRPSASRRPRLAIRQACRFAIRALLPLLVLLALANCAFMYRGKCYIEEARYQKMRKLFTATNSLQQVEQAMEAEGWSLCERNEFRYRLNKDLNLEPVPEPADPAPEILP